MHRLQCRLKGSMLTTGGDGRSSKRRWSSKWITTKMDTTTITFTTFYSSGSRVLCLCATHHSLPQPTPHRHVERSPCRCRELWPRCLCCLHVRHISQPQSAPCRSLRSHTHILPRWHTERPPCHRCTDVYKLQYTSEYKSIEMKSLQHEKCAKQRGGATRKRYIMIFSQKCYKQEFFLEIYKKKSLKLIVRMDSPHQHTYFSCTSYFDLKYTCVD
jgi:hypothetical protein